MNFAKICNKIIEYSFYALFLLTPLAFTSATSELFEMNKMWFVWSLTIVIAMSWLIKMTLQRKFFVQRTALDIPIVFFLLSQIISTIFSLDSHVSLWGYYSRFNGGLFSIIAYIFLYYAFLSNFQTNTLVRVKRSLSLSLVSGLIVALWGLPSHFGYDPTCFLFRKTFDVSCWTADFMPKARIFSTLGQPDWLAAYLAILIPISIAFFINSIKSEKKLLATCYLLLATLFYIDLLYTNARSGFLGIWLALIFFAATYFWLENKKTKLSFSIGTLKSPMSVLILGFLIITFVIGTPISQLRGFTLDGIGGFFQKLVTTQAPKKTEIQKDKTPTQLPRSGGTESGEIRLSVWNGAINAWKANPLFGTGVETFAFAYYKHKPATQNLTSEWNFLYNKAHNEYLNYLATTGLFGLGTYLLMIGYFLTITILKLKNEESQNNTLILAILAGYISMLITNFFGFSVVMTNVYLFMIPAFIFVLSQQAETKTTAEQTNKAAEIEGRTPVWQWTPIFFTLAIGFFMLYSLVRFWQADVAFALGYNLDQAREYQQAYPKLHEAVKLRGDEPVFKDELSINNAIIAAALVAQKPEDEKAQQNTISIASSLAQEAINISNEVVSQHPNNTVFWKTRTRLFHTLSQADSRYLPRALDAIVKASLLAPNDANIWYNLGVLYGQNNNLDKGISTLEKTILLKPDYKDAYYGLGLFYHQKAIDKDGKIIDSALQQKAIAQMQYILEHLSAKDTAAQQSIDDWSK